MGGAAIGGELGLEGGQPLPHDEMAVIQHGMPGAIHLAGNLGMGRADIEKGDGHRLGHSHSGYPGQGTGSGYPEGPGSGTCRRSEEHTSELQSLMRISYAVFCLTKKRTHNLKVTMNSRNT